MVYIFRGFVTILVCATAYFAALWLLIIPFVIPQGMPHRTGIVPSLVIAIGVSYWVWRVTGFLSTELVKAMLTGSLAIGGVGFVGGFLGPLIVSPESNQGPLLGIFITGPLGLIFGAIAGGLYWYFRRGKSPD